ncbi:glycoside hydrolase, family 16 [Diplocarpon rosae]|nr:glycoside hydrolase, family 16 [Diplocarpon rosae]
MSVYFAVGVVLAFAVNPVSTLCECGYRSLIDTKARPLNATERDLVLDGDSPNLLADRLVGYLDLENVNTNTDTQAVSRIVATPFVWTDLLETDFLHLDEISKDTDWSLQNYSVSAQADRGPFGMRFLLEDVELNRIPDLTNWTGPGENGGDPGLQLSVQAGVSQDGFTSCAQMNSVRDDMLWGSYRALLKLPLVSGTCSAFFWYFNDSQEIDMEILSSQFYKNNNTFLINLVHQSPQSASQGFSVIGKDYEVADLPFDPTSGFHEYRIDYLPDQIIFYGDGQVIGFMNSTVSPQPGHLILTHWSNGDKGWSGGPPVEEAVLSVAYVKAYFNSSNPVRQADHARRCPDPNEPGSICNIEDYSGPINLSNLTANGSLSLAIGPGFFFMQPNMTGNQTVYQSTAVGYHKERTTWRNTRVCLFSVAVLIGTLF